MSMPITWEFTLGITWLGLVYINNVTSVHLFQSKILFVYLDTRKYCTTSSRNNLVCQVMNAFLKQECFYMWFVIEFNVFPFR